MEPVETRMPETTIPPRPGRQRTILWTMVVIAGLAPLFALARYPFAFGLVTYAGTIALFVALNARIHRYDRIAWLLIFYPVLPLLVLYTHWSLATRKMVSRGSPLFDGLIGLSDTFGYLCILAYIGCVAILIGSRGRTDPELRKAAKRVVLALPVTWFALFAFAIWDPFGMLGYFFR